MNCFVTFVSNGPFRNGRDPNRICSSGQQPVPVKLGKDQEVPTRVGVLGCTIILAAHLFQGSGRKRLLVPRQDSVYFNREASATIKGSKIDAFFSRWSSWLEDRLVPALKLERSESTSRNGQLNKDQVALYSDVFTGQNQTQDESSPCRRFRSLLVDGGGGLQAFNAVLYPSPHLGLVPILGIDVLSFNNHKRLLFGVDWAPALPSAAYAEARIFPFLKDLRQKYEAQYTAPSGKFYGPEPEFFSPQMFLSRAEGEEAMLPESQLWNIFREYVDRYVEMLGTAKPAGAAEVALARERQIAYDQWHAARDPALPIFRKIFGEQWTEDFIREVLFPGTQVQSSSQAEP